MNGRIGREQSGFALVIVLGILAVMTVLALGFGRRAVLERQAAWYALDQEQAMQHARAAATHGLLQLRNKGYVDAYEGRAGYSGYDQQWARPVSLLEDGVYFASVSDSDIGGAICEYRIEDVSAKIPVNSVPESMLHEFEQIDLEQVHALLDRQGSGQNARNRWPLRSPQDIRRELDLNPQEWNGDGEEPGMASLLTAWGYGNRGTVNVNTAPRGVLSAIPGLTDEGVAGILAYRAGSDGTEGTADDRAFRSNSEVAERTGLSQRSLKGLTRYGTVTSREYVVRSRAVRRNGAVSARCEVYVQLRGPDVIVHEWRETRGRG